MELGDKQMKLTMNKYIYEYNGKELSVGCQIELPKEKHFETAKNCVIKEYGTCDESKLVFKKSTITTGYFEGDKFIEEK